MSEHTHTPAKVPPADQPRARRRFKKRYALAAVSAVFAVALGKVGTFCVQLTDETAVCISMRLRQASAEVSLGACTPDELGSNALYRGDEAVCGPTGWARPDGGPL